MLLLFVFLAGAFLWRARMAPPAPLPTDRVLAKTGWADESRCSECHEQAESFWDTGHAQTLRRAEAPGSRTVLTRLAEAIEASSESLSLEYRDDAIVAVSKIDGRQSELELDWCFGSGHHAMTWVGLLEDSWGATDLVEFRWTWFRDIDGFAITPGQPNSLGSSHFAGLGMQFDHPKTRRCFACHATQLSIDEGRLDLHTMRPGVTCQRCHGPMGKHVETDGDTVSFTWRGISQEESIRRCAQCHRLADEQAPEDIRPDNPHIARFQPVGLVQSPCFQSSPEMTCLTCHDPHRPLSAQDSLGDWQCIQCHDPQVTKQTLCSAGFRENCLQCHMPKVRGSSPLHFTDHWIRVRETTKASAALP